MQLFLLGIITSLIPSLSIVVWLAWRENVFAERDWDIIRRTDERRSSPENFDFRKFVSAGDLRK